MIADDKRTVLVSSLGWVEHDALWVLNVGEKKETVIPLGSGARYLSPHTSGGDLFAVVHHFDGARFELTVHAFDRPAKALAHGVVDEKRSELSGDARLWQSVPRFYVDYLAFPPWKDFVLVELCPAQGRLNVHRLAWYDQSYDKGYQGVVAVSEMPDAELALVSVQRCSELVIHHLPTGMKRAGLRLAGRNGNPQIRFRKSAAELWALDYDTIVVLDSNTWDKKRSARLQDAAAGTMQFAGDFAFDANESLCVVARPFSGDVVGLDAATLKVRSSTQLGKQPLEVAVLPENRVVARDWKTGETLQGTLKTRTFWDIFRPAAR